MSNDTSRDWDALKKRIEEDRSGFESPYVEDVGSAWFDAGLTYETVLELIAEVERLRDAYDKELIDCIRHEMNSKGWEDQAEEAAAELSQLKAERDRMAEALGPMLEMYESCDAGDPSWPDHRTPQLSPPTIGELRRARSALNTGEKDG